MHCSVAYSLFKMLVQTVLQHDTERGVRAWLELKPNDFTHSLPVAVPNTRVAEGLQERKVLLEFVQLHLKEFSGAFRVGLLSKCPGELVHGPPHATHILLHLLSIQLQERTWKGRGRVQMVEGEGADGGGGGDNRSANMPDAVLHWPLRLLTVCNLTIHPLFILLVKVDGCFPEPLEGLGELQDHLYLREGGHLPL